MHRRILEPAALTEGEKRQMLALMTRYYDGVCPGAFARDLAEKTHCILLQGPSGEVLGFSTQRVMALAVGGRTVHGVFSGDTIIHEDHWGSFDLHKTFAETFIPMAEAHDDFYWFLISKGYKTYKMLPLFFQSYYPSHRQATPPEARAIMDAFGQAKYPGEYDAAAGVIVYRGEKDRLKPGFADIEPRHQKDEAIRFFQAVNPDHRRGNDLVCLASLKEANLKGTARRLFLGR